MSESIAGTVSDQSVMFWVDGKPYPKARPRAGRNGSFYTPSRTRTWENYVAQVAKFLVMGNRPPLEGPVKVELTFYGANDRADVDNLAKAMLDAMNGIVFGDDSQVCELKAGKALWRNKFGVTVSVARVIP